MAKKDYKPDQTTFKIHKWVDKFAGKIKKKLEESGYPISKIAVFDIMAKRLQDEFEQVNWKDDKSIARFVESLIDDIEEITKNDVKVTMRNIPRSETIVKTK